MALQTTKEKTIWIRYVGNVIIIIVHGCNGLNPLTAGKLRHTKKLVVLKNIKVRSQNLTRLKVALNLSKKRLDK